jgi:hypothetical protein
MACGPKHVRSSSVHKCPTSFTAAILDGVGEGTPCRASAICLLILPFDGGPDNFCVMVHPWRGALPLSTVAAGQRCDYAQDGISRAEFDVFTQLSERSYSRRLLGNYASIVQI